MVLHKLLRKTLKQFRNAKSLQNTARKGLYGQLSHLMMLNRLEQLFTEKQIDCILDVGANCGQFIDSIGAIGFNGYIISFEPDPIVFENLKNHASTNANWIVQNLALGNEDTSLVFNRMKSSCLNSFLAPSTSMNSYFESGGSISEKITVPVRRLDNILPELQEKFQFRNVFLKMDTQGYDLKVFEGSASCLDLIHGIMCEAPEQFLYNDMPNFIDYLKTIPSHGFITSGVYPVHETNFPSPIEFNVIFARK